MKILIHMGDPLVMDNPCTKRMTIFKEALEKNGHEVIILAPDMPGIEHEKNVIYCKTPVLRSKTMINRLLNQVCLGISSYMEGRKIHGVDAVLTTCPPPLINISGARIAKKQKAKLIYDVRDIWPDVAYEMGSFSRKSIYGRGFSFIRNYMLKNADLVMAVSKGKVEKLAGYAPKQKIINIPNGYNTAFEDIAINKKLYEKIREKGKFICTYIGNIGLAQGIIQLIELAEEVKKRGLEACFLVYGSGAEERKLRQYLVEHQLDNFSFEGRLSNKDMKTVLAASDINFVSLVNENLRDSVPTKLYEALGVGCPVLLAAQGDSAEILNETGLGISVRPNDKKALWEAFNFLYTNPDEIVKRKETSIMMMKTKYSLQQSAQKFAEEIEKLLNE